LMEGIMMEMCPFCWGGNIKRIGRHTVGASDGAYRDIMECEDCERWFWAGTGEEVPTLFMNCETALLHPMKCYPEVLEFALCGGAGLPRRRWAEFNHLCAGCRNGRYVRRQGAACGHDSPLEAEIRSEGFVQTKG